MEFPNWLLMIIKIITLNINGTQVYINICTDMVAERVYYIIPHSYMYIVHIRNVNV